MHLLLPCFPFLSSEIHLDRDFCHAQAVLALTPMPLRLSGGLEVEVELSIKRSHASSVSRFE
jgi:hypothetical protein